MEVTKPTVNAVTNVAATAGIPVLLTGVTQLIAGDWINGAMNTFQGVSWLIGFYLVVK